MKIFIKLLTKMVKEINCVPFFLPEPRRHHHPELQLRPFCFWGKSSLHQNNPDDELTRDHIKFVGKRCGSQTHIALTSVFHNDIQQRQCQTV